MTDKTREVYKDKANDMPIMNPFVEMPKMRVDAFNRVNELIKKSHSMPVRKYEYSTEGIEPSYLCPRCGDIVLAEVGDYNFCHHCGQRVDVTNIAF